MLQHKFVSSSKCVSYVRTYMYVVYKEVAILHVRMYINIINCIELILYVNGGYILVYLGIVSRKN